MAWFEMTRRRALLASAFACLTLAFACGGSSDDDGRSGTTDGGSGTAGKGSGGSGGASGSATGGASGKGGSSGSGGTSGSGGKAGSGSGGGSGVCGGLAGFACEANEWCDYPPGAACGATDVTGTCRPRPSFCTEDCPGVCGCDGNFHCNECIAQRAGVDITGDRSCTGDGGLQSACSSDNDCRQGLKCCYPCGQAGCMNQCISPLPNGMCPLFP